VIVTEEGICESSGMITPDVQQHFLLVKTQLPALSASTIISLKDLEVNAFVTQNLCQRQAGYACANDQDF
jgi:hypothetical protein